MASKQRTRKPDLRSSHDIHGAFGQPVDRKLFLHIGGVATPVTGVLVEPVEPDVEYPQCRRSLCELADGLHDEEKPFRRTSRPVP